MGRGRLRVVLAIALLGAPACSIEGPGCPTDLEATPNGRDGVLFFSGGGYVQDGLWKQLTIPAVLPGEAFSVATATLEFHEPTCVIGSNGFPLVDANGDVQCEFDVDVSNSSATCRLPEVEQDLQGVSVETTSIGTNVVLGTQIGPEGISIQVACDVAQNGGLTDPKCRECDSGVHVLLREPTGEVRKEDTIWITCDITSDFGLRYAGLVGEQGVNSASGTVNVGDEFNVRYSLESSMPTQLPGLFGYGMVPADANPSFEIVAYEHPVGSPAYLRLRALAPADHPILVAGTVSAPLPVTILP